MSKFSARIISVELGTLRVARLRPFKIALREYRDDVELSIVRIATSRHVGLGSSAIDTNRPMPPEFVRGELESRAPALLGQTAGHALELIRDLAPSSRMALDISLHDLLARGADLPLRDWLAGGTTAPRLPICHTIGIESLGDTVVQARELVAAGFRALKLKVGMDVDEDLQRARAVRAAVGPDVALWADANQGYAAAQAVRIAAELIRLNFLCLEQPVRADRFEEFTAISRQTGLPIYADESASSMKAIEGLKGYADGIVLKVARFGGISGAKMASAEAARNGLSVMLGCFYEMAPSIAAGMHLALALGPGAAALNDLDSFLMLAENPFSGLEFADGQLATSGPGLGIEITERVAFDRSYS